MLAEVEYVYPLTLRLCLDVIDGFRMYPRASSLDNCPDSVCWRHADYADRDFSTARNHSYRRDRSDGAGYRIQAHFTRRHTRNGPANYGRLSQSGARAVSHQQPLLSALSFE